MYDCQQCGACCVDYFGTPGYIELNAGEARRMRRLGLPVVNLYGHDALGTRAHAGPVGDTCCIAFVGSVGGSCGCAIHPDRPSACVRFEAGSEGCKYARIEAGLPV